MLYHYFKFSVYFSKIFVTHIFWADLVPKSEVLKINWNLVQGYSALCLLWFWCLFLQNFCHSCFIFSNFFSFISFGQIWSQNLKLFKLTDIWYRGRLLYAYFDFNVYFFKILSSVFFGEIWSQNLKFAILTEIWYRRTLLYAYYDFNVYFFQIFCQSYFFGHIWSHNLKFFKMTNFVEGYIAVCLLRF